MKFWWYYQVFGVITCKNGFDIEFVWLVHLARTHWNNWNGTPLTVYLSCVGENQEGSLLDCLLDSWRISGSNRWPLACHASALASWANPPCCELRCKGTSFFWILQMFLRFFLERTCVFFESPLEKAMWPRSGSFFPGCERGHVCGES